MTIQLSGLARRLIEEGALDAAAAQEATQQASRKKTTFVAHLVSEGLVEEQRIATLASLEFGAPYLNLASFDSTRLPRGLVSEKLVRKHHVLPLMTRGSRLFVAVSDPFNFHALDEIKFHTGLTIEPIVVNETGLEEAITAYLAKEEEDDLHDAFDGLDEGLEDLDVQAVDEDKADDNVSDVEDAPIVRYVNKVLLDAIRQGASDIHFEPYERSLRIRYRTDGVLHEVAKPPLALASRIAARLKVMSQMDISERRLPQDGRIKMKLSKKRAIDLRVNTLPTIWGEKVVMRILDPTSAQMGIDSLGYEPEQKELYLRALKQPQGMIVVTGPTGSGKTVSLYTGLNILNESERNISTAEDPVEINLEGINQVNVNTRIGLDFATALRSFLRQDPDIIMVGEIRDVETAEIAIKAAQTGHLVLSTLHTNSAAESITRLLNMGIAPFNLATTLSLIIAQRLARRLCTNCRIPADDIPREVLLQEGFREEELETLDLHHPNINGCKLCHRGYKGRVGIYEVVRITRPLSRLIMSSANALDLAEQAAAEGFDDLRRSALRKAARGIISLEEVNRITKD